MPARIAGVCGLLAFVTFNVAWIAGGLAQPSAYSAANDDISDLGAMTPASPWIYNRVGANLTGILVVLLGLGLWRALSPDVIGRIGAAIRMIEQAHHHINERAHGQESPFDPDAVRRLGVKGVETGKRELVQALSEGSDRFQAMRDLLSEEKEQPGLRDIPIDRLD